jgi:hypothetical protein
MLLWSYSQTNLSNHVGQFRDVTLDGIDGILLELEAAMEVQNFSRQAHPYRFLRFVLFLGGGE